MRHESTAHLRATQISAWIGQALAFVGGFYGLFSNNPVLIFIAFFIFLGAMQESAMAQMKDLSQDVRVGRSDGDALATAATTPRSKTPSKRSCAHRSTSFPWWMTWIAC